MDAERYITEHWIPRRIWTHLSWPRHQDRLRRCAEALPERGSLLDVGCACGHSTEIMRGFRPEASWFGADFSRTAIAHARNNFPAMTFYRLASPADLATLAPFDGVVCSEVLEHTPDDSVLAESLLRVTAGTLVVTTPWTRVSDPGHLRVYTEKTLRVLFEGAWAPGKIKIEMADKFLYLTYARGK